MSLKTQNLWSSSVENYSTSALKVKISVFGLQMAKVEMDRILKNLAKIGPIFSSLAPCVLQNSLKL